MKDDGKARKERDGERSAVAAPTSERMRRARASGRTPGSSTAFEPAAVPLGTDDEAAGTPASVAAFRHEIERAQRGEGLRGLTAEQAMSGRPGIADAPHGLVGAFAALGVAVMILMLLAVLLF
ncbi:MAG: hypothetical protein WBE98_17820 [Gammaproteobacteria bacterium]